MAETVEQEGPLAAYFAEVNGGGKGAEGACDSVHAPARIPPAVHADGAPSVVLSTRPVRDAFVALVLAVQTYFGVVDLSDEVLDEAERERAYQSAWSAEDGAASFAERFKYTIATSFLLTPTLSISMYGTDTDERPPVQIGVGSVEASERHSMQCTIRGQIPSLLILSAGTVVLVLFMLGVPISLLLLLLIGLDALTTMGPLMTQAWRGPRTLHCALARPPNAARPRYLAAGMPTPSWVADERAWLQSTALSHVSQLVKAAHTMDKSINAVLAVIQEVELVARGYSLSTPLPPISRMEEVQERAEMGAQQSRSFPPRRLTALRKMVAEQVDQVTFHCAGAKAALAALVQDEVVVSTPKRPEPVLRASPRPDSPGHKTATLTPRSLARFALATPPRRSTRPSSSPMPAYQLGVPRSSSSSEPSVFLGDADTNGSVDGTTSTDDESLSDWELRRAKKYTRSDRLSLASLRTRFEQMHVVRVAFFYRLLALDFSMQAGGAAPATALHAYWDQTVIHAALEPLTKQFRKTAAGLDEQVRTAMGASQEAARPAGPPADFLQKHMGLADRMAEMARTLRTIQCKLHVCGDDWAMPALAPLHGTRTSVDCNESAHATALYDSMRHDLLALSSEWEAGLKILASAHAPDQEPAPDVPPAAHVSESPPLPPVPVEDEAEQSTVTTYATHHELGGPDTLSNYLMDSTSPSHLAQLGEEEVFEGDTEARHAAQGSALPRAERIRQMREERERAPPTPTPNSGTMVTELKDVLSLRKTHRPPALAPTAGGVVPPP